MLKSGTNIVSAQTSTLEMRFVNSRRKRRVHIRIYDADDNLMRSQVGELEGGIGLLQIGGLAPGQYRAVGTYILNKTKHQLAVTFEVTAGRRERTAS